MGLRCVLLLPCAITSMCFSHRHCDGPTPCPRHRQTLTLLQQAVTAGWEATPCGCAGHMLPTLRGPLLQAAGAATIMILCVEHRPLHTSPANQPGAANPNTLHNQIGMTHCA